jgi:hypothetical protein
MFLPIGIQLVAAKSRTTRILEWSMQEEVELARRECRLSRLTAGETACALLWLGAAAATRRLPR